MPKPLAITLIVLLIAMLLAALAVIGYDVVRGFRRYLEHRDTTASWVSTEPPGLLDYEPDATHANERFIEVLNKLNADTERLGEKLGRHAKRMERSAGKSGRKKQRLANRSAREIHKSAVFTEKRLELLDAVVKEIRRNTEGVVGSADIQTDEDIGAAKEFAQVLLDSRETTAETIVSVNGYCETVRDIERQNLARTVTLACRRQSAALDGVVKTLRRFETGALNNGQTLVDKIQKAEAGRREP